MFDEPAPGNPEGRWPTRIWPGSIHLDTSFANHFCPLARLSRHVCLKRIVRHVHRNAGRRIERSFHLDGLHDDAQFVGKAHHDTRGRTRGCEHAAPAERLDGAEARFRFGELMLIDGLPRTHDAVADCDSLVWCVPQAPLEAWLDAHPRHWREIARLASRKLRIAFQIFDQEIRSPMTERVARRLRLASLGWGWRSSDPRSSLRLSQEQLARMLGTSRSSVNKSLRELERSGAIGLHYGAIEVTNLALLVQACGTAAHPARTLGRE